MRGIDDTRRKEHSTQPEFTTARDGSHIVNTFPSDVQNKNGSEFQSQFQN